MHLLPSLFKSLLQNLPTAQCLLTNNIHDYHYVSQGKVTVASIDDAEDMQFAEVSSSCTANEHME